MTNIALIVLDTLRKDAFDDHFDWLPGTRFENAWSTSHWTVPAHASLFTGRYASEAGVYRNAETLDYPDFVLSERLREAGYTTRAFSANPNVSKQFDFDRGFDQFEGSWRLKDIGRNMFDWDEFIARTRDTGPERYLVALWRCLAGDYDTIPSLKRGMRLKLRDLQPVRFERTVDDGAAAAVNFVERTSFRNPEFLFVNLMEAHAPYSAPEEYQTVDPPDISGLEATFTDGPSDDPERIRQAYRDEVRYLSDQYERLFGALKEEFDVIITLSDHGELLGEHGAWEHMYGLYPELVHVPLALYHGDEEGGRREVSVSLVDVYATILRAAGLDADGPGRDLRDVAEDGEFLTEYHGISDRHYQSLLNKGFDDIEHLDGELRGIVNGGYYGHETFDEFEEYGDSPYDDPRERVARLAGELDRRDVVEDRDLDEAVMDQLKDLGYA